MGDSAMRVAFLLLVATALADAHAAEEVRALESLRVETGESSAELNSDELLIAADSALREHGEVMMQLGEASPVVGLTRRIKHLQADIKSIRSKKKGANSKNLDADLNRKNHELASLTIKQHAAAAAHAGKNAGPPPPKEQPLDP